MQTRLQGHPSKGTIGFHSEQDKFTETLSVREVNFLVWNILLQMDKIYFVGIYKSKYAERITTMKTDQARVQNLIEYVRGLQNRENGKELYLKYRSDIEKVTPQEAFEIFYHQLQDGLEPGAMLTVLDKVINVFYRSLVGYSWAKPQKDSFLDIMMQENRALTGRLEEIKKIIKEKDYLTGKNELADKIRELLKFDAHYLKKENILFPFLEKKAKKFDGLSIMWALHDETRTRLKKVIDCLERKDCKEAEFNQEIGTLFFDMYGLVQKEELILFPAATEIIEENEWIEMKKQSMEYEFPFIGKPEHEPETQSIPGDMDELITAFKEDYQFRTETGVLNFEQILMIFNALPVDLTFVDENNQVRFFTRPKDRIFPRSPAIIGRNVEKCHPPESVHVVQKIIDAFKAGTQDNAAFWIRVKGKMILIQYFALRDTKGEYKGVLEVSQDITGIKELEGEKRLLQWDT